jgi:type III secretory pathway component EscT
MVDIGLVFSGKSAKQFNLYDLSNTLRNLILLIILPVYFVFFISFYTDEARLAFDALRRFLLGQ